MAKNFSAGKKVGGDRRVVQFRMQDVRVAQLVEVAKAVPIDPVDLLELLILNEYQEYVQTMMSRLETERRRKAAENVLPLAIEEAAPLREAEAAPVPVVVEAVL